MPPRSFRKLTLTHIEELGIKWHWRPCMLTHIPGPQHHIHCCWPSPHTWWSLRIPLLTLFSPSRRELVYLLKFCLCLRLNSKATWPWILWLPQQEVFSPPPSLMPKLIKFLIKYSYLIVPGTRDLILQAFVAHDGGSLRWFFWIKGKWKTSHVSP